MEEEKFRVEAGNSWGKKKRSERPTGLSARTPIIRNNFGICAKEVCELMQKTPHRILGTTVKFIDIYL